MLEPRGLQLPQEVLDTILENLRPFEDTHTLRQCALTARRLLPTTQRILFRTIFILDVHWSQRARIDQLSSLLKLSPHLAQYTKSLYLFLQSGETRFQHLLPSIIPRLSTLQKIELHTSPSFNGTYTPFTSLQIITLLGGEKMPRIQSFKLVSCTMSHTRELFGVCEWLAGRDGLVDILLCGICVRDNRLGPLPPPPARCTTSISPIYLREFTITQHSQVVHSLLEWATSSTCLRFNKLQELTVGQLTEHSSRPLLYILEQAKSSLTCLHFEGSVSPLTSFQFDTFRQLGTISLHLSHDSRKPSPLKDWCSILRRNRQLKLDMFIIHLKPVYDEFEESEAQVWDRFLGSDHPWKEFERLLIDNTGCGLLELRIVNSYCRIETDTFRECFPLLHRGRGDGEHGELVVKQKVVEPVDGQMSWEYMSSLGTWRRSVDTSIFETCAYSM